MSAPLDAVIDALLTARRTRSGSDATSLSVPTADDAYLVQAAMANELGWFDDGPARHWKSGGASRSAVMTHAPLPPAGIWASPADARDWPFRLRYIEAEVALRLGRDVDADRAAGLDMDSARALVDAMAVSIEIVDSRWQQAFAAPQLLRLADLQSHGALVLGAWQPYAQRDWLAQGCRVQIGDRVSEHRGSHSCGDPAWVLPDWLRHATRDGEVLPAGSVVSTGTWCGALEAHAGELVVVQFDGLGEARVQL
ncbi:MAG TPA: fumarylacetoacetate hydrolase family protein [Rhizobacter sp.]|nr:fumarylacetoacetate hydrolase family protein [Rhizobacter sp.]